MITINYDFLFILCAMLIEQIPENLQKKRAFGKVL